MKHLSLVTGIYAGAVLETDPASWSTVSGVSICPMYLLVCLAAWTNAPLPAALWGALIGFVADALTTGPLGIETVLVATIGWCAARVRLQRDWRSSLAFFLFAVTVTGGLLLCSRLARAAMYEGGMDFAHLLLPSVGAVIATGLCGLLLLTAARAVNQATRSLTAKPY